MKIVVIDDDFLITTALKTILEADEDIRVADIGSDGSDALPLYRTHKPCNFDGYPDEKHERTGWCRGSAEL